MAQKKNDSKLTTFYCPTNFSFNSYDKLKLSIFKILIIFYVNHTPVFKGKIKVLYFTAYLAI